MALLVLMYLPGTSENKIKPKFAVKATAVTVANYIYISAMITAFSR